MHPEIDFRGLTPNRHWEASDAGAEISEVLRHWFEDSDEIEALDRLQSDAFADRERVATGGSGGCACSAPASARPPPSSSTGSRAKARLPGCCRISRSDQREASRASSSSRRA